MSGYTVYLEVTVRDEPVGSWATGKWYTCRLPRPDGTTVRCDVDHRVKSRADDHARMLRHGCYVLAAWEPGEPGEARENHPRVTLDGVVHTLKWRQMCVTKGDLAHLRRRAEKHGYTVTVEQVCPSAG